MALLVGFVTALASAALTMPVAAWAMEALEVSNREGGRGFAIVLIWVPLALLLGFVSGFVVSFMIRRAGFAGYAMRQGIALALMAALILGVGGLVYGTADHPPLIDRKNLALEIETRVPTKGRSLEDLQAQDFTVALVVSDSDRSYSDLRWQNATRTEEFITVPAWAGLNSRNAGREITAGVKDENRQIFNVLLGASPGKTDDSRSERASPRERFDHSKPAPNEQYLVRYRVRFAEEYSPTPTPSAPTDPAAAPAPNESATPEP
ncbi:MAG: hypothetical protein ACR2HH_14985 [Chthoniobacterales bacterium]